MNTAVEPNTQEVERANKVHAAGSSMGEALIRVKGKNVRVPAVYIDGRSVIASGNWIRTATVQDEDLIENDTLADPVSFIQRLKESDLKADLFTFSQRLPDTAPKYNYRLEWDNVAAIPISKFSDWWDNRVDPGVRRAVRKSTKSGVVTKVAEFDDEFVAGISRIYNETPMRQGKPFWHYLKGLEDVRAENATYSERNIFLGAYLHGEMIGFIRLTKVGTVGSVIQILSMTKDYDKRPTNALIAKAVEVCEEAGMSHLMYCNYVYNDPTSSLTEFKRRNGFEKILLPRYYVPLTVKGNLALQVGLHQGVVKRIPQPLLIKLLKLRNSWYARSAKKAADGAEGNA